MSSANLLYQKLHPLIKPLYISEKILYDLYTIRIVSVIELEKCMAGICIFYIIVCEF